MRRLWVIGLVFAASVGGQTPVISNAKLETRAAASLNSEIEAAASRGEPLWLGYAVQAISQAGHSCCFSGNSGTGCFLEGRWQRSRFERSGPVELESSSWGMVLIRLDDGTVERIRFFSMDCPLDAGGLPFVWLTGVTAGESLAVLRGFSEDGAIVAIAMHAYEGADRILEEFVQPSQPIELSKKAAFWLGSARGNRGVTVLQHVLRDDPRDRVREHAVFALSQSKDPAGLQTVIRASREDRSARVRGQALFWMAQVAGARVTGSIERAIEDDPDTEVKRQAVFALTQLPKEQGIPALIRVAREHKNPAVRRQAFFWLGQSEDSRALDFLMEVLNK